MIQLDIIIINFLGGKMKKIVSVLLLLMFTFLSFSNNLDKYESKRIFEQGMKYIVAQDYKAYRQDPEMSIFMELISSEADFKAMSGFSKKNKYEVTKVKETNNKSTLDVRVNYVSYDSLSDEEFVSAFLESLSDLGISPDSINSKNAILIYEKLYEKYNHKGVMKTKNIKVTMNKVNGFWGINYDKNLDLISTLSVFPTKFFDLMMR